MANRIRTGDTVVILAGKDKGKTGKVLELRTDKQTGKVEKVVVENMNRATKHVKKSQQQPNGGRVQVDVPLHVSNVAVADPKTGKPTRIRFETRDGVKHRVAVKSGESLGTVGRKAAKA